MKVTDNFDIREFVPPAIWRMFGIKSIAFVDQRIIDFAQWLRDKSGMPVIVNNWHLGGTYTNSGYRMPDCEVGGDLSQHKFGRGVDCKIEGWSGEKLRNFIVLNWNEAKQYITTIEDGTTTWLHADCRQTNQDDIYIVAYLRK